ncbi:N-acetylglucosaminyltransferase [Actinoplanes sp. SE50]|uniref:glycosyltransferase family 2 protein n=1 Tax=unclassified Actinoplanes TaxID=2626549 RepID=UPI00023ECD2F|nr:MULTISPECIES: glycosyltransferase family 2 protein [unclassified Actinoplanes]AEV86041.1 N-acetylglucosaminyltransferase [Actinoplanes sp. SE50/110]ATO84439.1 N-acetylglucosaminyltransferase [Actinoplanes sp. SE50]SLM01849.1 N-acetylglucosaminyltransferase [Actinoplanes sp. SE50/110]
MTIHPAAWAVLAFSFLVIPVLWVLIDRATLIRAGLARPVPAGAEPVQDFTVLVPIYGSVRYLENVDYLAQYGGRVVLCTTDGESAEFYAGLGGIAERHGFRIFRAAGVAGGAGAGGKRATSGTIRDRLVRDALEVAVHTPYVVCIDADTTTERPFGELVGQLVANGYDFASVPLVPTNDRSALGRLQAYEYRTAMKLRIIAPWQVSGACHVARTEAHREVMRRHSLFFQGNDVEAGLLAGALGLRVGHLPFHVATSVPETFKAWYRQRLAWSGGEFRLFAVNAHLLFRHPFFWLYGSVITLAGFPLRWLTLATGGWTLLAIFGLHSALIVYMHWPVRTRWLALMPLYTLFNSVVMTPLGAFWYFRMAIADRNAGLIRTNRPFPAKA